MQLNKKRHCSIAKCRSPSASSCLPLKTKHKKENENEKNLREFYSFYKNDCFIQVYDEIAKIYRESKRKGQNYRRKIYWNKAHYSPDRDDGIEHDAIFVLMSPYEIYQRKITNRELHSAIAKLPDIQAKKIYAHYFLDMSKSDIAKAEGVSVMAVCKSIFLGLKTLEKELRNFN